MKGLVCLLLALTVLVSTPMTMLADTGRSADDLVIDSPDGRLSGSALQAQGPIFAQWKLPKQGRRTIPVHIYANQEWTEIFEQSFRPWDAMLPAIVFTYHRHPPTSSCPLPKGQITVCTVSSLSDGVYGETYSGLKRAKGMKDTKGKEGSGFHIVRAQIRVSIAAHRDGRFLDRVEALNTGCHEMAHALGGNHRHGNPNSSCVNNQSNRATPGWQDRQAFRPIYKR